MTKANRSSEHDVAFAVMKYLNSLPSKSAVTADVKHHVPDFIHLTDDDQEVSETRPNEQKWHQVVGNIVSHRNDSPDNFVNRGLLSYDGSALGLTEAGANYLNKHNA